ncbi:hypothetical protein ABPG75_007405 [Micractinium tetrahymenae]
MSNDTTFSAAESLLNCTTGEGGFNSSNCYKTQINGDQIVSGMVVNLVIGMLCFTGFVVWRDKFCIYFNRLRLPEVPPTLRPPPLDVSGLRRLWSWLVPVFTVSDKQLLESAGLDALMAQRVIGFGNLMFAPLTILGVGVLLPVNYTSYVPDPSTTTTDVNGTTVDDAFLKMTMSAIPKGSSVLWLHFTFTFIFMGWVCFLLVQYYKEFISLRQAHDQQLVRSAELGRRCSLLDDQEQSMGSGASARQIMSQLRLRLSLASGSWAGDSVTSAGGGGNGRQAGGDMAGKHVAVRFSFGLPSEPGSGPQILDSALGSGSVGSAGSGGALRLRGRHSAPHSLGSAASGSAHGAAPHQSCTNGASSGNSGQDTLAHSGLLVSKAFTSSHDEGAALVAGRKSNLAGISEGDEGVEGGAAAADDAAVDDAAGGIGAAAAPAGSGDIAAAGSVFSVLPSPFSSAGGSGALKPLGSGGFAAPEAGAVPVLGAPSMRPLGSSGGGKGSGGCEGGLEWDELAEPFPLMRAADAAQFYTVLIVDEAFEEFSARHEEKPWIWKLPKKIAGTPRAGREVLNALFTESKALAHLKNKKQEQHLRECERRMQVAEETYREIFGADFDRIVPVYDPRAVDKLLHRWYNERLRLDRLRLQLEQLQERLHRLQKQGAAEEQEEQQGQQRDEEAGASAGKGGSTAPGGGKAAAGGAPRRWCACSGPLTPEQRQKQAAQLEKQRSKKAEEILDAERGLADLQGQIEEAQIAAAEARPAPCFFATFRSAQAAAYAAQLNLNPLHERMMRALPAPAPSNVNYTALLRGWMARGTRPMVVFLFVLVMLLFPIGTFAGICGTIVKGICNGNSSDTLSANGSWFCSEDKFAALLRTIISSVLPSILLTVWQAVVLPLWFYTCAQAEGTHHSFTSLDLRCGTWFFLHDLFNVFLGGMLGGSVVYGLRQVINDPSQFFTILGQAVPASSNFFINFVSFKGIAMAPFRLFFPHAIVFGSILKWLRIVPSPKTERDKLAAAPPISIRYSRDLGVLQLTIFVVALGYAVVSPIILPFASLYFLLTWPVWRYQLLYVYQGHFSAGGQFWIYCAHRIVVCLGVMASFTAAVMAVKGGYVAALILFFTSVAFLIWFDRYLTLRYDAVVSHLPAVGILRAPPARVEDRLYVPPPMRHRAVGWTPEWGKAWYGYGAPRYAF